MSGFPSNKIILAEQPVCNEEPRAESALEGEVVELFDQLRNRIMRHLLGFHFPVSDCEEIIQETFLALFQHLRRGRSRSNLRGWLFRVAHNLALKKRQKLRRDLECFGGQVSTVEDLLVDPEPNPEDRLSSDQKQRKIQSVVRALPEQDRRCLVLRAEGLRYRDISEVMGMSLGAVAMSLERSLARIARASVR